MFRKEWNESEIEGGLWELNIFFVRKGMLRKEVVVDALGAFGTREEEGKYLS